ncbi:Transmembrane and TPR repeat-containing protein 3 [Holothuria leucospilota]|uniref:dolichyl-phosphate-mannose--protein mannosyltransferase n=1 Tax=Holothuria leucospilota TaxID=206669 RepID=A0A9Q1H4L5_HOLLE|nr:Transmembrane and TPR repeat-containing protein 3 [Holothuria leucospilota]
MSDVDNPTQEIPDHGSSVRESDKVELDPAAREIIDNQLPAVEDLGGIVKEENNEKGDGHNDAEETDASSGLNMPQDKKDSPEDKADDIHSTSVTSNGTSELTEVHDVIRTQGNGLCEKEDVCEEEEGEDEKNEEDEDEEEADVDPFKKLLPEDERQRFFLASAVLLFVCFNCFFNSLQGGFVFDDHKVIVTNLDLRSSTPILDLLKNDFWGTPLYSDRSHKSYRPLTVLTFRWNFAIGGLEPTSYHFFNMLLHWALCVLMMKVFKMFLSEWLSFWMALLFLVHPIHTDAVTGIVGRAESLSSIFALLSLICYARASGYQTLQTNWNYIGASFVLVVMATLCKEQGITMVAVCCAYEVLWLQKITLWDGLELLKLMILSPQKMPLWFVAALKRMLAIISSAAILIALRIMIMGAELPHFVRYDNPIAFANTPTKQLSLSYLFPLNAWLLICPWHLICDYSGTTVPLVTSITDPRNLATLNFFAALGALTHFALTGNSRLSRQVSMGLAFLVFPFLPASNIFFCVGFVIAERILYTPSIGYCMLVVIGVQQLLKQKRFKNVVYLFLLVTVFLHGARTARRNLDWKSKDSLFRSGLQVTKMNAKLWLNLGHYYENKRMFHEALACYNASMQSSFAIENGALTEMGRCYMSMGDDEKAVQIFEEAQKHMAPPVSYQRYSQKYVQVFYNLGEIKMKNESTWPEAENLFKKAIRLNYQFEDPYKKLSNLYHRSQEYHKAVGILKKYLSFDSRSCNILNQLGELYLSGGKHEDARKQFEQCLRYQPQDEKAQFNIVKLMERDGTGSKEEARDLIKRFEKLLEDSKGNRKAILTKLGELHRGIQEYDIAISYYSKILEVQPDDTNILTALSLAYKGLNNIEMASSILQQIVQITPNDHRAWQRLGEFFVEDLKMFDKGKECFEKALELNPESMDVKHNMCVILTREGKLEEGAGCFEKLIEENPLPNIVNNLELLRKAIEKKKAKEKNSQIDLADVLSEL